MLDRFGRQINYLRISVTDRCNLRCVYCRAAEAGPYLPHEDLLTLDEIVAMVRAAVAEGVDRVRLTGGEPLLREDIVALVAALRAVRGIKAITMTTNGLLLAPKVAALKAAGLSRLNISLDTLRADRFHSVTGGKLEDVLRGIQEAEAHFEGIKLNVVVMRGVNDDEVADFVLMTMNKEIEVRFIEHMALGEGRLANPASFVSADEVLESICKVGRLTPVEHDFRAGPARRFRFDGARGTIGLITPVSQPFCGRCNRLRLTSEGKLRSCLLRGGEVDVRAILRNGASNVFADRPAEPAGLNAGHAGLPIGKNTQELLREALHKAADLKPKWHEGCGTVCMSKVGG
jgi:cyclic pyranopterin phosphate synthase